MHTAQFLEAQNELVTLRDMIRWVSTQLTHSDIYLGHGTNDYITEARHLTLVPLGMPITLGDLDLDARLTSTEKKEILALLEKRIFDKIPTAYLTQRAFFADLMFYVNEHVLIPRSPIGQLITEKLSPYADNLVKKRKIENEELMILDLCTGSGCIAIALAYAFENASIDAVDISFDALAVCDENIQAHQLTHRVFPIQSDLFDALGHTQYDFIITNPPYVDAEDMSDLPEEFLHEPELALASGSDGLDITKRILKEAKHHLKEEGFLICEVGNSMVHLIDAYPHFQFEWIEFKKGGDGVFIISKSQLDLL
ncbi:50S ribosomal protein L3 N(5)-glutamine methyltransferase [Thorsellia kenyensis]|uniref:50S ribosomal protein L3 N(5)-glutamine methyltransferase n=1 Tax=Thorsellia kenyensis TaxID=1549888 RepID=A0ABV6C8Y6_9GAMM